MNWFRQFHKNRLLTPQTTPGDIREYPYFLVLFRLIDEKDWEEKLYELNHYYTKPWSLSPPYSMEQVIMYNRIFAVNSRYAKLFYSQKCTHCGKIKPTYRIPRTIHTWIRKHEWIVTMLLSSDERMPAPANFLPESGKTGWQEKCAHCLGKRIRVTNDYVSKEFWRTQYYITEN